MLFSEMFKEVIRANEEILTPKNDFSPKVEIFSRLAWKHFSHLKQKYFISFETCQNLHITEDLRIISLHYLISEFMIWIFMRMYLTQILRITAVGKCQSWTCQIWILRTFFTWRDFSMKIIMGWREKEREREREREKKKTGHTDYTKMACSHVITKK